MNALFKVKNKYDDDCIYNVYGVEKSFSFTYFLIYNCKLNEWVWVPADEYIPV